MKRLLSIAFIASFSLFLSCSSHRTIKGCIVKPTEDGNQRVTILKNNIAITYFGDYWFHDLVKNKTLHWSNELVELLAENKKRQILYAAHTTTPPHCSSVGVLYKDTSIHKFTEREAVLLKEKNKARNFKKDSGKEIGTKTYVKFEYDLRDGSLKVNRRFVEYYTVCNGCILRIIFWTMEIDKEGWLVDETEGILKTLDSHWSE